MVRALALGIEAVGAKFKSAPTEAVDGLRAAPAWLVTRFGCRCDPIYCSSGTQLMEAWR